MFVETLHSFQHPKFIPNTFIFPTKIMFLKKNIFHSHSQPYIIMKSKHANFSLSAHKIHETKLIFKTRYTTITFSLSSFANHQKLCKLKSNSYYVHFYSLTFYQQTVANFHNHLHYINMYVDQLYTIMDARLTNDETSFFTM